MHSEEERLRTFFTWPSNSPVMPTQLASCGFFATGNFLEVECHWCHCKICDWEYGENVEQKHMSVSPNCEFFTSRTPGLSTEGAISPSTDFMIESNRLATFKNWPVCYLVLKYHPNVVKSVS